VIEQTIRCRSKYEYIGDGEVGVRGDRKVMSISFPLYLLRYPVCKSSLPNDLLRVFSIEIFIPTCGMFWIPAIIDIPKYRKYKKNRNRK